MPIQIQHVKRRMRSIGQIQKVTGALQKVSSARFVLDRRALMTGLRYAEELSRVLRLLLTAEESVRAGPPQSSSQKGEGTAILCFGSERGLCGGFNTALVEELARFLEQHRGEKIHVTVVGTMLARKLRRAGLAVDGVIPQPLREKRVALLESMAAELLNEFSAGRYREIHLLFMRFVSAFRQIPTVTRLLPPVLEGPTEPKMVSCSYEPSAGEIVFHLLPEYVRQLVTMAFLHSATSENAARQSAMNRATTNAGELLAALRLAYTRLRQES
ncbi:MAG: F0F1 ATP synthase subunit gamma, partial [Kiritimatiellae bacterium]|nr:F0F1 ATP synthase subunit gamma [Kiritimatiellia bacterium]